MSTLTALDSRSSPDKGWAGGGGSGAGGRGGARRSRAGVRAGAAAKAFHPPTPPPSTSAPLLYSPAQSGLVFWGPAALAVAAGGDALGVWVRRRGGTPRGPGAAWVVARPAGAGCIGAGAMVGVAWRGAE